MSKQAELEFGDRVDELPLFDVPTVPPAPEPQLEPGPGRSDYRRARLIKVVTSGWCLTHVRWMAEHPTGGDCRAY